MRSATLDVEATPAQTSEHEAAAPGARAMKSVVIASLNRDEGITGVHTHTRSLLQGLRELGCDCRHVSSFSGSRAWLAIFAVRPMLLNHISRTSGTLWYRHWHEAALRRNLEKYLRRARVDVIVAQCPVSAHAALEARRRLGLDVRVVMVCHFNHSEAREYREMGELSGERAYQRMLDYESAVLREVDQVIYVSDWARQVVEKERGIQPRSSAVILNAIAESAADREVTRESLGLTENDLVLINVGTLEPRKNQVGLLDLFELIVREHANAKLLLVGEGSARDEIARAIAAKGLAGKAMLLGARSDVPALLKISDLYLHYAKLENCPVVLLEAARAGVPFAAIPAGGIGELQRALGLQIELDEHDREKSLRALESLLNDADLRRESGARIRAAFKEKFTTVAMAQSYVRELGRDS